MKGYPEKIYLNGTIVDSQLAKISVFDRGFLLGDGIYEVMVQINGHFFYKKAHLDRLKLCLQKIRIDYDVALIEKAIPNLLETSQLSNKDCMLYIQVTRGVAPRRHSFPKDIEPTVLMYATPKILPDINEDRVSVVTMEDNRWSQCDIKMISLLGNVLANERAMQNNCYETLFIRNGIISEASHCNVFFVKKGIIYTHPANSYILDGVTRQIVFELCEYLNIELIEEGIPYEEITTIDEAFLTGTSTQIVTIKKIDDHIIANNSKESITKRLQEAFLNLKKSKL